MMVSCCFIAPNVLFAARAYKDNLKCARCPEDHWACLEFHHEKDKEITLAKAVNACWSIDRILKEMEKCIVLCANCHRKLHHPVRAKEVIREVV